MEISSILNRALKPIIHQISDSNIRNVETEVQNVLNPTLMVEDFISRNTEPYVIFNTQF